MTKDNRTWLIRKEIYNSFYDWFEEQEGYGFRCERFWDAVEREDHDELLQWLKIAWRLGHESAKQRND